MILYVDSSALMRRYLQRPGGTETDNQLSAADMLGTASVTQVEVAAALTRLAQGGSISKAAAARAIKALENDIAHMWEMPVDGAVVQNAYDFARRHALKGYDAVQLGAAASWRAALGEDVTMVTFDDLLWAAAQVEGFGVWPPDPSVFK